MISGAHIQLCPAYSPTSYCVSVSDLIGERPYLTTKIITLSEFFNFVHQVSRLYTSDQVTVDAFGNHLG
jgi:hypothetical protein